MSDTREASARATSSPFGERSFWGGFLVGIGVMAAVDEIVFHQILGWHHFYDLSTPDIALLSDGLLHAAELFLLIFGFTLLLDARRRRRFWPAAGWAGFVVGLGLFQLFDGIVDHKILRVHQIRYGVDIVPYDIVWNAVGGALLLAGIVWTLLLTRRRKNQTLHGDRSVGGG